MRRRDPKVILQGTDPCDDMPLHVAREFAGLWACGCRKRVGMLCGCPIGSGGEASTDTTRIVGGASRQIDPVFIDGDE